jgi:hypothetical protein
MNDVLLKPIGPQEGKNALFQLFPTKAPGPDGFPAHFFQRQWDLCGGEVTAVVLRVLRGEDDPAKLSGGGRGRIKRIKVGLIRSNGTMDYSL